MKNFLLIPSEKINNKKPPQRINRKRSFLVSVTSSTVHTFTFSGKIHVIKKIVFNNLIMYSNKHFIIQLIKMIKQRNPHSQKNRKHWSTHRQEEGRIGNDRSIIHVRWQGFLFQKNTKMKNSNKAFIILRKKD